MSTVHKIPKTPKVKPLPEPLHNRVIILPDPKEGRTKSGIILPQTAQERPARGTVIAVGPGQWEFGQFIVPSVKVKDRVVYTNRTGTEIEHEDVTYIVMRDTDIFAKI